MVLYILKFLLFAATHIKTPTNKPIHTIEDMLIIVKVMCVK